MDRFERIVNNKLMPLSEKLTSNKILGALMEGFIRTTPITLGIAFITIVGNFPVLSWIEYLTNNGIMAHITAITNGATGVLSLYIIFSLAMAYAKRLNVNEKNAAIISLAFFIMVIPQTITSYNIVDGQTTESIINALKLDYLGGQGLFIGMIIALSVTKLYAILSNQRLTLKLPDSVPSMVTQSLEPVFSVTIIFILAFIIRVGFSYTSAGDVINFFINVINAPIASMAASPMTIIIVWALLSVLWFFGIHNAVLQGPLTVLSMTMVLGNITAYQTGQPLPYMVPSVIYSAMLSGGFLGFMAIMMVRAKSSKFKQLGKLSLAPALFGITEPLMFGIPIIMNPMFFIPLVLPQIISGFVAWGLVTTILPVTLNPLISLLPWTTPVFIKVPLAGGINFTIIMLICFAINILFWYPFIKAVDKKEYALEMENNK